VHWQVRQGSRRLKAVVCVWEGKVHQNEMSVMRRGERCVWYQHVEAMRVCVLEKVQKVLGPWGEGAKVRTGRAV